MIYDPTDEEKSKFKEELEKIISESSEDIKKLWESDSNISWFPGLNKFTITSNVHLKFANRQKDKYTILVNKFNIRRL